MSRSALRLESRSRVSGRLGQWSARVQAVGPLGLGVVSIDCAKRRSVLRVRNALGQALAGPLPFAHTQPELQRGVQAVQAAREQHQLRDLVVAVEQTGTYHLPVVRAFRGAGYEVRLVHPRVSRRLRQALHPGNKTDTTDLDGVYLAACQGLGLLVRDEPAVYQQLRVLARHRRDLVKKQSLLQVQLREAAHQYLPGFLDLGADPWQSPAPLAVARAVISAQDLRQRGRAGLTALLRQAGGRVLARQMEQMLTWADQAPLPAPQALLWQRRLHDLDAARVQIQGQIAALERDLAHLLVQTPFVLLLALPGIHVASAAEYAAELGTPEHYAHPNQITGRAGLVPSRYQSDAVDHRHGRLRRAAHRALRYILVQIAANLVRHNHHFAVKALAWKKQDKTSRWIHVKVAKSFSRLSFAIVVSGTRHCAIRNRSSTSCSPSTARTRPTVPRCSAIC